MQVFQRLHKTAGSERRSKRPSRNDSDTHLLKKMGTEPSEKLLRQQSWKEYFSSSSEHKESYLEGDTNGDNHTSTVAKEREEEEGVDYQRLYKKLVKRILNLWKEMKIPQSDRDFYAVSIIKEKYHEPKQIDDLTCYVKRLMDHRRDTVFVLRAIKEREQVVDKCNYLVTEALRNYNLKLLAQQNDSGSSFGAFDADHEAKLMGDIKLAISRLQTSSANVVRLIKMWRDGLWRPQPFVYKGSNYLIKMKTDTSFLQSKSVQRILKSIPLDENALACVTFPPSHPESSGGESENDTKSFEPLPGGELEGSITLDAKVKEAGEDNIDDVIESHTLEQAPHQPKDAKFSGYEDVVSIVESEENVQRALRFETSALRSRGTFIPSLRFELDADSNSNLMKDSH